MNISYITKAGEHKTVEIPDAVRNVHISSDTFRFNADLPNEGSYNNSHFSIAVFQQDLEEKKIGTPNVEVRYGELDSEGNWWHWKAFSFFVTMSGVLKQTKDRFTKRDYNEAKAGK